VTGCFYRRLGTDGDYAVFESTDFTRSNWSEELQHGSPPLALLTGAIEQLFVDSPLRIGRLCLDLLGAVPVAPLRVRAWVERPGKRIALCAAEMLAQLPDGRPRPVARVSAWLLAISDTGDATTDRYGPLTEGESGPLPAIFEGKRGYFDAMNWRPQRTPAGTDAVWWGSPLVHVVDDEPDTPLLKLATVADSANGAGAVLDPEKFVFMNTDTAVHLHRLPTGEDFGLRARASIGPDGAGVTTAELFDRTGFIGTTAQTLLVQRR
jgi:hypothetical protein